MYSMLSHHPSLQNHYIISVHFQVVNRNQATSQSNAGSSAGHPSLLRNFQSSPAPTHGGHGGGLTLGSPRGGIGARRQGRNLNLRDIIGDGGGGASGAGLGAGVPQQTEDVPMRRDPPVSGSPFSNFDKIV